jgi:hypothetical protein
MSTQVQGRVAGILARFESAAALLTAAQKVRDAGYRSFDCHSPFPIHGMDAAMGLKRSMLGWIVGSAAVVGTAGGLGLQWWTSSVDYPMVISGKPFFSYQAYVPIAFGLGVLLSAFAAVVGMLALNRLPRLHHPVFHSDAFGRFSDDGFFVSVEANDPQFDAEATGAFLTSIGGLDIEVLREG